MAGASVYYFVAIAKASHFRFILEDFLANIGNIIVYYMIHRCSPSAQFYLLVGSMVLVEYTCVSSAEQTIKYLIYTLIYAG